MTLTKIGITQIEANQNQKEVTINEAFHILSTLLNGVLSQGDNTVPGSVSLGDAYIIGSSPSGAWAGQSKKIAFYFGGWKFIAPKEGMTLWVNDEDLFYVYDGSSWLIQLGSFSTLGVNETANSSDRLVVKSPNIKFLAESTDLKCYFNKTGDSDSLEMLFQRGLSSRFSMGLLGNNNFTLKASTNGSSFTEALVVNNSDSTVKISQGLKFGSGSSVLNNYEEGTFTPVLAFGGNSVGMTYSTQSGSYVRVGNIIVFNFRITLTAKGSSTGSATVTGVPYYPSTFPRYGSANIIQSSAMSSLTSSVLCQFTNSGVLNLVQQGASSTSSVNDTNFTSTSSITVAGYSTLI